MATASKLGPAIGAALAQGHEVRKRTLKKHASNGKKNMFLTYILEKKPIQVSLEWSVPP